MGYHSELFENMFLRLHRNHVMNTGINIQFQWNFIPRLFGL